MLTLYRPPRGRSEGRESEVETKIAIIPPGTPYLTKVNGKLVMAREKKGKSATLAIDLLGEAFGVGTRVIRKRAKSLDKPKTLLLIGGVPYVPQQQLICTAPLPQQTFPPSMVSMPQYQQLPAPQKFTVPNPNPTKEDFEQLKRIGAHYNENFATKETKLLSSGPYQEPADEVEAKPRAVVTITNHICANCGRLRSKKYHHNNPIKPGENPTPVFCKKCQKDASSTSDSDTSERPPKTKQKKKKTKTKKKQTKPVGSSSEDETPKQPSRKESRHSKTRKKEARRVPSEVTIVEEDHSDEEARQRRGRPRGREKSIVDEYDAERRPLSPLATQSTRFRSIFPHERYEVARKPAGSRRITQAVHRRSPPPLFRYVEVPESIRSVEPREEQYPRRVPIHFVDDEAREPSLSRASHREHEVASEQDYRSKARYKEQQRPRNPQINVDDSYEYSVSSTATHRAQHHPRNPLTTFRDNYEHSVSSRAPRRTYDFVERGPPSRDNSFEEWETGSPTRSQRLWRERASPVEPVARPCEGPHIIHPRDTDEHVVVTERYVYRPKKPYLDEEGCRRQEHIDRVIMDSRSQREKSFAQEGASRYYHDDWLRDEPVSAPRAQAQGSRGRGYRRDEYQDSELAESEAGYRNTRADNYKPPRASTPSPTFETSNFDNWQGYLGRPPSAIETTSNVENWQGHSEQLPYPLSSDSEATQISHKLHNKGRAVQRYIPPDRRRRQSHNISTPRPAYARNETDDSTGKELIPSPRISTEQEWYKGEVASSLTSGMMERERIAEKAVEERHVVFRDTISEESVSELSSGGDSRRSGSRRSGSRRSGSRRSGSRRSGSRRSESDRGSQRGWGDSAGGA